MSDSARTCPICSTTLAPHAHEGIDLDTCPAGHGSWLDKGELSAVVMSEAQDRPVQEEQAARAAAAADAGQSVVADGARAARGCPVCSAAMRVREYPGSGVAIDECAEHGIWLDTGELERIEAYGEAMRRQVAEGTPGSTPVTAVRGIAVPQELLAAMRSAAVPPA